MKGDGRLFFVLWEAGLKVLTQDAVLVCKHDGHVQVAAVNQSFVTIDQRLVLVATDPEGRPIGGCPMAGPGIKPCTSTLRVMKGYSTFIKVSGHALCLDTVEGLTDGSPPGTVEYLVRAPGQSFVAATS